MKKPPPGNWMKHLPARLRAALMSAKPMSEKRMLKIQAAAIVQRIIRKAQHESRGFFRRYDDPMNLSSVRKEDFEGYLAYMQRPTKSRHVMQARAAAITGCILANLMKRHGPSSKG